MSAIAKDRHLLYVSEQGIIHPHVRASSKMHKYTNLSISNGEKCHSSSLSKRFLPSVATQKPSTSNSV
jgi:hypothetical protein